MARLCFESKHGIFKHANVVIFIMFILTNMENNQLIKTGSTLLAIVLSFRYVRKNIHMYTHTQTYVYTYIHTYAIHTYIHIHIIHTHTLTHIYMYTHSS